MQVFMVLSHWNWRHRRSVPNSSFPQSCVMQPSTCCQSAEWHKTVIDSSGNDSKEHWSCKCLTTTTTTTLTIPTMNHRDCLFLRKSISCSFALFYSAIVLVFVCMVCMVLITTMSLCARSQDLLLSVSVRRVHVAPYIRLVFIAFGIRILDYWT